MCGYAGAAFCPSQNSRRPNEEQRHKFLDAAKNVAHRGNDDARHIFLENLWLQHYRLAFQDVAAGAQPMYSADGTWVIVFNGEIYNHLALRTEISNKTAHSFKTRSDTETILAGYVAFGAAIVEKLEGEFSFVVAKSDGKELFAARDVFGVKPLFFELEGVDTRRFATAQPTYNLTTPALRFASEIKGLACAKRWNRDGLLRQFVGLYEPICTPFESIIQIPPGGSLHARATDRGYGVEVKIRTTPVRMAARSHEFNFSQAQQELQHALRASVRNRLLSDVELGVYLSGGIDSKTVAYELAQSYATSSLAKKFQKPKSFTVGFEHTDFDESAEAIAFANHLGFDAHLFKVTEAALAYSYPHAVATSENIQPYTNGAAKWWLSKFTRNYVHGVLTGDGSDEVFGGYPSFRYAAAWKFALRTRAGKTFHQKMRLPLGSHWRDSIYTKRFLTQSTNPWAAGASAAGSGIDFVRSAECFGVFHPLFEQISHITAALLGNEGAQTWLQKQAESVRSWFGFGLTTPNDEAFLLDSENTLLLWQNYFCRTHLPVQVLNWVGDRMEMANTLEGRTPFLSREIRDCVARLPDFALVSGFQDKAILRRAYQNDLTRGFASTPKKQFGAPFLNMEKLRHDFCTDEAIRKSGLADADIWEKLKKQIMHETDPFVRDHLQQTQQTLLCFSIVQATLVEGQKIERDEKLEEQVTQRVL